MLRRSLVSLALLALVALSVAGCGNKTAQNGTAASDSLLASSPVEQPQGQLPASGMTPDSTAQATEPAPAEPAPAATPAPKPAKKPAPTSPKPAPAGPSATVAAGTNLGISMSTALTSETATVGQSWAGTLNEALVVGSNTVFPAGSTVNGVVEGVAPAARGDRAYLVLRVTSISANGKTTDVSATADSMIAGSTRKRNIGAIAGGAAAGALIGKAVGGSGKSAAIGAVLGGAAATGAVAASKGFQVEVPQGKSIVFHIDHDVKVKL